MYPTITDLIKDIFGIYIPLPIQTFGFFVALALILASWVFSSELKRKEREGLLKPITRRIQKGKKTGPADYAVNTILGFILGFKLLDMLLNYIDFVADPQFFILSTKGNIWGGLIGAAAGIYLKYLEIKKEKADKPYWVEETLHPHQHVGNMTLIAAFAGLLGAKVFHNLENPHEFLANPIESLLSFSGLTIYGGLICGGIAVLWYARKQTIPPLHLTDAAAPILMLGYGVGRLGCHFSGDGDWGIVNTKPKPSWLEWLPDWAWAYHYPNNVIKECNPYVPGDPEFNMANQCNFIETPYLISDVFPTPLYESVIAISLFLVLMFLGRRIKVPGMLFSLYLIMNGTERFFIEKIRVNETYNILGLHPTQAEIISVLFILTGIFTLWYFRKNHKANLK
jgi:phosphatidylglycerol---prolipoprotein diacylglyceryl transferase